MIMTSRDWLAVLVVVVIVAGVILQAKRASSPHRVRSIPDRIAGDLMLCQNEGAILFASRDLAEPGSRGPLMLEAVSLRLDRKGELVGSSKVGREYVVDASRYGKTIYALR